MKVWIYLDGRQQGPFELEQLLDMPVTAYTLVWFEGLPKWSPAGTLPQMQPLFDGTLLARVQQQTNSDSAESSQEEPSNNPVVMSSEESENPENAQPQPQQPYQPSRPQQQPQRPAAVNTGSASEEQPPYPPTYIGWSVALLICCTSPLSLAALIASICVTIMYNNGNYKGASRASEWAAWLVMISIALGFIPVMFTSLLF